MKAHLATLLISASLLITGCDVNNQSIVVDSNYDYYNYLDQSPMENKSEFPQERLLIITPSIMPSFLVTMFLFIYLVSDDGFIDVEK